MWLIFFFFLCMFTHHIPGNILSGFPPSEHVYCATFSCWLHFRKEKKTPRFRKINSEVWDHVRTWQTHFNIFSFLAHLPHALIKSHFALRDLSLKSSVGLWKYLWIFTVEPTALLIPNEKHRAFSCPSLSLPWTAAHSLSMLSLTRGFCLIHPAACGPPCLIKSLDFLLHSVSFQPPGLSACLLSCLFLKF